MNARRQLERLLATDPLDAGCAAALEMLAAYAQLLSEDPDAASRRYSGLAAHFRACGPCAQDLEAVLRALGEEP